MNSVIIGLALAGAGALIVWTAGGKLIKRAIWRWKWKHLYPHAPRWPDKVYWTELDRSGDDPGVTHGPQDRFTF